MAPPRGSSTPSHGAYTIMTDLALPLSASSRNVMIGYRFG